MLFYSKAKFDIKNPSIGLVTYLREFYFKARRKITGSYVFISEDDKHLYYKQSKLIYYGKEHIITKVDPLLTTKWDQELPYNNTVTKHKGNYFVGCVAVATGQIMAYYQKNNLKTYNWSRIHNTNIKDVISPTTPISDFLWDIAEGVKTKYGSAPNGDSLADNDDARRYFIKAGYTGIRY